MPRLKLVLAYQGTDFSGWQVQAVGPGRAEPRTVQGCLEKAISKICDRPVRVHGSGRTDSGVHALGQVAHCDIPDNRADVNWPKAVNGLVPDDMAVLSAKIVSPDFHARYSSRSKVYVYSLWSSVRYVVPQRRHFTWAVKGLDAGAMETAAKLLTGRHDFAAFQNTGTPVKSTVRTLARIKRGPGLLEDEENWTFQADGFLKQMVRNLMGLLVDVGRGRLSPDDAAGVLARASREEAGYRTAPARGLTLARVDYGDK